MAKLLKGSPVASALMEKLSLRARTLMLRGVPPTLAIVRVGEKRADLAYETAAQKRCDKIGINVQRIQLPENVSRSELLDCIHRLNEDSSVHGILVFRPLPCSEDETAVRELLNPEKDVDGMTRASIAGILAGSSDGFCPCTAEACVELLDHYGVELKGTPVTVIGASMVIGKPIAMMLLNRFATVTVCHIYTQDTAQYCRGAKVLISAAGCAGLVCKDFTNPDQIIIDVGINRDAQDNICGDSQFDEVEPMVDAITPVPGGVGNVTTSILARHVIEAAEKLSL